MDLTLFNQTLGCFLGFKLVRIDMYVLKKCLCNVTDSIVIVQSNYQLKACINYIYIYIFLYKQRTVKIKTTLN